MNDVRMNDPSTWNDDEELKVHLLKSSVIEQESLTSGAFHVSPGHRFVTIYKAVDVIPYSSFIPDVVDHAISRFCEDAHEVSEHKLRQDIASVFADDDLTDESWVEMVCSGD